MSKKIVVINASPRKGRNTDQLCQAFAQGAQQAGNEVFQFSVSGKKINGCIHCMQCYKNGPCAQKDDMLPLYEQLEQADMVVFASPIYFWQVTAQLKAVIDRMYALYTAKRFPRVDTAMILVAGGADPTIPEEALNFYHNVIVNRLHWQDKGTLVVSGTTGADFDLEAGSYLEKAKSMGAAIQ